MNRSLPLPPRLESTLSDYRKRVWIIKLLEGALAALFGLALSYLLVLGLDRLMETPTWLRGLLLFAGAAGLGLGLPLKWHRWVWKQRRLEDAARLLRWKFPRLGDQLLGIVELAREDGSVTGRSERLVAAAMEQADEAVKGQDLRQAVPQARHARWAWAAGLSATLIVAGFLLVQDAAWNAFQRWLLPWGDTERYTFARVEALPDPLVVPLAETFSLPVHLQPEARWKPDEALARIPEQPAIRSQKDASGSFHLAFPPQTQDTQIALSVGDVRKRIQLQPRPRPELTDLKVRVTLPDYLQYTSQPEIAIRGGTVSVLKASQVAVVASTDRPLTEAFMDGQPVAIEEGQLTSPLVTVPPETATPVTFTWEDAFGLQPLTPLKLTLSPKDDEAPKIVARRDALERVVLDSEVVTFDISASDDFGIQRVGLAWQGVPDERANSETATASSSPIQGSKVVAAGGPELRELTSIATFSAVREGVAPQTLEIHAWAEDYLEDRAPSKSATFVLHVLNQTDHALWVTTEMGKWLDAAKESYEREQQLHETNKELRSLSAAALDQPENRRRVAQQAQAETANAARLDRLNQIGRQLVEHATKNPEFEAERLESWATLLQSLQDIAANRMPSVAELLKQSANAKAGSSPSTPPSPSESSSDPSEETAASTAQAGTKSGPQLKQGPGIPGGGKPSSNASEPSEAPPAPSLQVSDGSMGTHADDEVGEDAESEAGQSPPGKGSLGLPTNALAGRPGQSPPPPGSPAQQSLDQGLEEQRDLLTEFARVSDELSDILASLEASTFVKRLKAASRHQVQLASSMRQHTLSAFGLTPGQGEEASETEDTASTDEGAFVTAHAPVARETATEQSEVVNVIKSDLEAYMQRRPDRHFKNVISEMRELKVVQELKVLGEHASSNLNGLTIHGAEYWADTLDRWAEEMVKAASCSSCSSCSSESLPPEIVLKVMQALRDEMALRDETRELENARPMLEQLYHALRTDKLAQEQKRIREHTESAIEDILNLPDGAQKFGKPLQLLTAVVGVMNETTQILNQLETGAPAIAAETEVIELLLQTKRQNPGGGGGGGDSPGGGGGAERASLAALSDLGPGGDAAGVVAARPVGQATGTAGRAFPEEYQTGLDAYFNLLETATP